MKILRNLGVFLAINFEWEIDALQTVENKGDTGEE
jgi:hypothetical protein